MTFCLGKNRRVHDTKPEHKSGALRFTDCGIVADLNEPDDKETYVKDLRKLRGTGSVSGEEDVW